jgi:PAS domain S-box-containing protein
MEKENSHLQSSEKLQNALNAIAHDKRFAGAKLKEIAHYIVELAAAALDCQRVSVWIYTNTPVKKISCLDLWDRGSQQHESGAELDQNSAASYLRALDKENIIVINDVMSDPRCPELASEYLPSNNIASMLDAPFQFDGKLAGVLCFEHVGSPREWSAEEQHFSMGMASLLSIATERGNRQLAERLRNEEESRYRDLLEGMPDGVAILQNDIIAFVNARLVKIAGLREKSEIIGRPAKDFFPYDEKVIQERGQHITTGGDKLPVKEYVASLPNGSFLTLEISSNYVVWNGQDAIQSIIRDVSNKVETQQALSRSETMLAEAEETALMGTWRMELPGTKLDFSKGMHRLQGTENNESVILSSYLDKVHGNNKAELERAITDCATNACAYEIIYRLHPLRQSPIWIEEKGRAIVNNKGVIEAITASCRDITRQQKAELDYIERSKFFQNLVNAFSGGFIYSDTNEKYRFMNGVYAGWIKVDPEEIIGKTIREVAGEEIYKVVQNKIAVALNGEQVTFERHAIYPNGEVRDVQISYIPDIDDTGIVLGFFSIITDITDLKQTETALRQSQKMEAVGQLTGGIAHDFNNILTIVIGNLEHADDSLQEDSSLKESVTAALRGVERAADLTNKLLGFSRSKSTDEQLLDVNVLITNMRNLISQSLTASIEVTLDLEEDLPAAFANASDFEHVLLNLALNAKDAMGETGTLTIATSHFVLDPNNLPKTVVASENWADKKEYIVLSVQDSGEGLRLELQSKAFEPFFTTKAEGKGTGLGLSMVYGFVKRGGGAIQIESGNDLGTRFNIFLPASKRESLENYVPNQLIAQPGGNERILIVDDEPALVRLAEINLKRLGYRTVSANSGSDAIDILKAKNDIDLLFTDIIMPGTNGYQLSTAALEMYPNLKILMASGYDKFAAETESNLNPSSELHTMLLKKPYNRSDLAKTIRLALDSSL